MFVEEHNEVLHRDHSREKYYGGGVDKNEKYGIMNVGSEAMYRKARAGYIEPMPKKQLHKIEKAFKAQGGLIQYGEETDAYLKSKNAEAITYNDKTILLKKIQAEPVFLKNLSTQHNIATEKMTEVMFQDLIARSRHRKSFYETTKLIS